MSPEQAHSNRIDQRSDLFSFGSVLYQMVSGRPPFRASSTLAVLKRVTEDTPRPIQEIIPEVPDWLCTIISKLHSKQPADRYQTANEVAELLARCQSELQHAGKVTCVQSSPQSRHHSLSDEGPAAAPPSPSRPSPVQTPTPTAVVQPSAAAQGSSRRSETATSNRPRLIAASIIGTVAIIAVLMLNRFNNSTDPASGGRQPSGTPVEISNSKSQISNAESEISNLKSQISNDPSTDPDRRAAEYVLSIGGTIKENGQEREIKAVGNLPPGAFELTVVNLNGNPKVTDAGLAHFKGCTNLMWLGLYHTAVTDAGLSHFKDCKSLMYLSLDSTQVSDAGLAYFKNCKELNSLTLGSTKVSNAGLAHFKDCKHLITLRLNATEVGDAGLAHFKDCKHLNTLFLNATEVSDSCLPYFMDCKDLMYLDLQGTRVSDLGLAHFKECKNLMSLTLGSTKVSDACLAYFKNCENLLHLNLDDSQVSDAGLPDLASLTSLRRLHLDNTRISLYGHEQLKAALPRVGITWSEPNRTVAENVLALGGAVEIGTPGQVESHPVKSAGDLPAEFFQVRSVSLAGVTKPLDTLPAQLALLHFPAFDQLESLDLSGMTGLGFEFLASIHGLKQLSLADIGMSDAGLVNIPKLPTLQRLVLDGNDIRGIGLKALTAQPELIDLSLGCPTLGDLLASNLAELKQIKRLSLAGSGLSDDGIKHLASLTNLESLDLRRTKATAAGIAELQLALPNCRIASDFSDVAGEEAGK